MVRPTYRPAYRQGAGLRQCDRPQLSLPRTRTAGRCAVALQRVAQSRPRRFAAPGPQVATRHSALAPRIARSCARCDRTRPPSAEEVAWLTKTSPSASRARSGRSEEHTSELQSLMRISYAVFCLKKKKIKLPTTHKINTSTHTH